MILDSRDGFQGQRNKVAIVDEDKWSIVELLRNKDEPWKVIKSIFGNKYVSCGGNGLVAKLTCTLDQQASELVIKFIYNRVERAWHSEIGIYSSFLSAYKDVDDLFVKIEDYGEIEHGGKRFLWIAMEEKRSIKELINEDNNKLFEECSRLIKAVQSLHGVNLCHRDIKPSNLLIGANGVQLSDFGLLHKRCENSDFTQVGIRIGNVLMNDEMLLLGASGNFTDVEKSEVLKIIDVMMTCKTIFIIMVRNFENLKLKNVDKLSIRKENLQKLNIFQQSWLMLFLYKYTSPNIEKKVQDFKESENDLKEININIVMDYFEKFKVIFSESKRIKSYAREERDFEEILQMLKNNCTGYCFYFDDEQSLFNFYDLNLICQGGYYLNFKHDQQVITKEIVELKGVQLNNDEFYIFEIVVKSAGVTPWDATDLDEEIKADDNFSSYGVSEIIEWRVVK